MAPPHPHGRIERFQEMTEAARAATLRATLATRPAGAPIWVFAYGSLMWRPCFSFHEKRFGRLPGYHRDYTIWTIIARGSPDFPGLGLALDEGGDHCPGMVFRLDETPDVLAADLKALWAREMLTGIYRPRWLAIETREGPVEAIAFVVDRNHQQYAGQLSDQDRALIIARACGQFGPCAEYLSRTVEALADAGAPDPALETLLARVETILALPEG